VHPGKSVELYVVMKMIPYRLSPGDSVAISQPPLLVQVLGVSHRIQPDGSQIGVVD